MPSKKYTREVGNLGDKVERITHRGLHDYQKTLSIIKKKSGLNLDRV